MKDNEKQFKKFQDFAKREFGVEIVKDNVNGKECTFEELFGINPNKEKQIFDKYGNYDFPTEIKQEGLNNATSQIEEIISIAKIVDKKCDYIKCKNCNILDNYTDEQLKGLYCSEIKIAENIYNADYRKIDKDSVVLLKAEKEQLLKEMYEQGKFDALADLEKDGKVVLSREEYQKDFSSQFNKGYKHGSNETAEKWYNKVKELYLENVGEQVFEHNWFGVQINKFAKQCGVEIKEN